MTLRFFLDEGVPVSVARLLRDAGHEAIHLVQSEIPRASPDENVCVAVMAQGAILVAIDGDMREIARREGVGSLRFRSLNLLKLSCRETRAAARVEDALGLIEFEWDHRPERRRRRLHVELQENIIRVCR